MVTSKGPPKARGKRPPKEGGRPTISPAKFALLCRMAELLAKRLPHLFEMDSGEAYIAFCRALKEEISEAFGGSLDNLFILETFRQMVPKYSEFEPWHHSEREKRKASVEDPLPEGVSRCARCVHINTLHGEGPCSFIPCGCAAFVAPPDFKARVVQAAVEVAAQGWDGS